MTAFDPLKGLGTITAEGGAEYVFHVIEIEDGSRSIEIGRTVDFEPLARFGRFEAGKVTKA